MIEKVAFLNAADPASEDKINALIGEGWTVHAVDPIPGSTHAIAVLRWGGPGRPKAKGGGHAQASS